MKKAVAVVFSYYPSDPRVRREAEALVQKGMPVDVICLKGKNEPGKEVINGVCIYRLPVQRKRSSKISYLWESECRRVFPWSILKISYPFESYIV